MAAEQEITSRIRRYGRITFAEFMELALFWPNGGYYSDPDNIGPMGDFYTAPSAHPAFGALLCVQVYQMWRLLDSPATFWVVEMGGGSGLLCRDLAGYAPHLPHGFADSLRYLCLERLVSHGIEGHLPAESRTRVQRLAADAVPLQGITGCFLSNELLDSFPVHRVVARDGSLKEIYVTVEDGRLKEVLDSPSTAALEERLQRLGMSLQEGNTAEINLAIQPWLEQVSSAMERGFIITIDYGHLAPEIYSHRRRRGTLACFHKHTETNDPYRHIGKQDMTAHVDFTTLIEVGRSHGLESLGFTTQREFLGNLGLQQLMGRLPAAGLTQRAVDANRLGMLDIIKPDGMGEFKVLAQGKGVGAESLWGFGPSADQRTTVEGLPIHLLGPSHMPLLEGRYPHLAADWEELWPQPTNAS